MSVIELPQQLPDDPTERQQLAIARLEAARRVRASGDRAGASQILVESLRGGLWRYARLWSELRSMMEQPQDYDQIRTLWWQSPRKCHQSVPLLNTVARAASVVGEHEEARSLLRKAILLQAQRGHSLRKRLGRVKRSTMERVQRAVPSQSADDFSALATTALSELNSTLAELDVRGFLISGTLLGYVRDGGFIAWDKDIDLGFFTSEISPSDLEEVFDKSENFHVRRLDFNTDRLRVNHGNGMMIDVFPHYEDEDGKVWHDGTATRWWNSPFDLKSIEFLGKPQYIPDPPERYLDENYGQWRRPEPNFDARLDAPNAEVTDSNFLDTLLYFALLDAVTKHNPVKAQRYVTLLRELGEGDWLERVSSRV